MFCQQISTGWEKLAATDWHVFAILIFVALSVAVMVIMLVVVTHEDAVEQCGL